ncbi:MAG: hypothetical protein J3Q66DRAFT_400550 [Benniella sp.]|nr:MAG: hypothetical protein J3Q66DRAFT_400550 [Benniella sp.]
MIAGTSNEAATDSLFDFLLLSELEYCKVLIDLPPSKDTAERKTPTFSERLDETTQTSVIPFENADYRLHTSGVLGTPMNTIPSTESPSLLLDLASLNTGFDMSSTSLDPLRYIPTRVVMASIQDIPDIWSLQDNLYQPSGSSITQSPFPAIDLPPLATPTASAFENPTMTASDSVLNLLPDWSFSFLQPLTTSPSLDPLMHPPLPSQTISSVPILQAPESTYVALDPLMSQGSSGEVLLTGLLSSCCHSSILSQNSQFPTLPGISCDVELFTETLESPKKSSKKRRLSDVIPPSFLSPESCKRKRIESPLSLDTLMEWPPKEEQHPSSPKSEDIKKVTDSAHYRPRNAFFMFRGFVSRIQTNLAPKWRRDSSSLSTPEQPTDHTLPSSSSLLSAIKSTSPRPRKTPVLAQTKVSVSCGKIWSSECFQSCGKRGCANCRMRSLFSQASDYLKLRQTELERRIEFSEGCSGHHNPQSHLSLTLLNAQGNSNEGHHNPLTGDESSRNRTADEDKHSEPDPSIGRLARMTLEDSFNWNEFQQLYYESDLFQWHREAYLGNDGILDLEEMKRLWVENERCYEKSFVEGAKKRFLQDGSKNSKKARQRRIG